MLVVPSPKKQTATWPDFAVLRRPGRPERDRQVGADDRVRAHHAVLDAGQVHRAALAAEEAGPAAEQLGEDRRHRDAAGQRVVVPAVGAERVVVARASRRRPRPRPPPGRSPRWVVPRTSPSKKSSWARTSKNRHSTIVRYIRSRVSRSISGVAVAIVVAPSRRWRRTARRTGSVVMTSRAVGGDDDLLLDPRRRHAVLGRAVRLEGDDHAFLELHRMLERVEPADDRALVEEQPDAVAELEPEALHLAVEAELLGLRPDPRDLVGRHAWTHQLDRARRSTRAPACTRRAGRRWPCRRRTCGSSRSCSR